MTAAREQIFLAVDALLAAIAGVQNYEREPSGDPDVFPYLALYDGGDMPIEGQTGTTQKRMTITVQGYVEGGAGAAAHAELNELHAAVVAAIVEPLMAEVPVEIVDEGAMRPSVAQLASERRFAFAQDFEIQFATPTGDPSRFA